MLRSSGGMPADGNRMIVVQCRVVMWCASPASHWRIQGRTFRAAPQRPKVACLPPPEKTVERYVYFVQLKMTFTDMSVVTRHRRGQKGYLWAF